MWGRHPYCGMQHWALLASVLMQDRVELISLAACVMLQSRFINSGAACSGKT